MENSLKSIMERKQLEELRAQKLDAEFHAFASRGVGHYPTKKGVEIDGRLVNLDPLEAALIPIITEACQYRGQSATGKDLAFMAQEVAKGLRREAGAMHLAEVKEACEFGRDGKFCEVFSINAAAIMLWIRLYVKEGYHKQYMEKYAYQFPAGRLIAEKARAGIEQLAKANVLETAYQKYQALKRGERIEDEAGIGIDLSCFMKLTRNGKKERSPLDPLWDHDGTGFEGTYASGLNALGWPGANLQEIFENMIADGVTTIKGADGYLIRRAK